MDFPSTTYSVVCVFGIHTVASKETWFSKLRNVNVSKKKTKKNTPKVKYCGLKFIVNFVSVPFFVFAIFIQFTGMTG